MSLLKCPKCGEMFSDSYKTCPFCEEDEAFANGGKKPVNPGRRVHRQKSPSILGPTLVLVLVLVAGVLLYTLIGSGKTGDDRPDPPKNPTEDVDPNTPTVTVKEAPKKDLVLRSIYNSKGVAQTEFSMSVGDPAVPMTVDGTDSTVKWSTEDSSIATINSDGEVTAVKSGKTMVVAVVDGQTLKCEVLVYDR